MKVIFLITFLLVLLCLQMPFMLLTTISFSYSFMQFILCLVHFYS